MSALVGLLLIASACAPASDDAEDGGWTPPEVGAPDVDIDTPELAQAKASAGVAACTPGDASPVENGLPEVELPCFGGGDAVDLSTLAGPLVINLWASWCGPCREEMPVFAEFDATYGDEVGVLGVDYLDTSPSAAMELVVESGVTYPLVADVDGALAATDAFAAANRGLPVTVIVDADGEVAFTQAIALDTVDEIVDLVEEHTGWRR